MNVIDIQNISLKLDKVTILNDISIQSQGNEIIGIIGPSGSGKTTLVKAMVGLQKVDQGIIKINDTKVPALSLFNEIGFMSQADALYDNLSARQNLNFFAGLYKINKTVKEKQINYLASLFKLEKELDKKVYKYSGGMKKRLSFALCLINNPNILVLDEPTVGLDPHLRREIWLELDKLKANGKTIVITTHVMDEALRCDRLLMIKEGIIIADGTVENLLKKYNVENIEDVFIVSGGVEHETV